MRNIVLMLAGVLLVGGCTSPTQRIATQALSRAMSQEDQIHNNLSDMVWQQALNVCAAKVDKAVEAGDKTSAASAIEDFSDATSNVAYLGVQHERVRSLFRMTEQYVWQQQGILDIVWREFKIAKARSDANGR